MHWTIYTGIKLVPTGLVPVRIHTDKKVYHVQHAALYSHEGMQRWLKTIPMPAGMDAKVKKSLKERSKWSPK